MNLIYDKDCKKRTLLSREEIIKCLNAVRTLVFMGYFEEVEDLQQYIDSKLLLIKEILSNQITLTCKKSGIKLDIESIIDKFLNQIPTIKALLEEDVKSVLLHDPSSECYDEVILSYPGIYAISVYRIAHELYKLDVPQIPRIMTEHAHSKTGIDIHPGADIGTKFFIDHGTGIVIGETTKIGSNVKIYQGVTLGALSLEDGYKLKNTKRHPTIKDNVTIYAGASILGGDTIIGENTIIGSNVFITKSVEANKKVLLKVPDVIEKDVK